MSLTADRSLVATPVATPAAGTAGSPGAARRRSRAIGLAAAVVAVVAVWPLGLLVGADYWITDPQGTARVDVPAAGGSTLIVGLVGWALLAVLERVSRHGTRIWTTIASVVAVVSLVPVFLVEATTPTRVALFGLHVVAAGVLVPGLRGCR